MSKESQVRQNIINSQNDIRLRYLQRTMQDETLRKLSAKVFKPITEAINNYAKTVEDVNDKLSDDESELSIESILNGEIGNYKIFGNKTSSNQTISKINNRFLIGTRGKVKELIFHENKLSVKDSITNKTEILKDNISKEAVLLLRCNVEDINKLKDKVKISEDNRNEYESIIKDLGLNLVKRKYGKNKAIDEWISVSGNGLAVIVSSDPKELWTRLKNLLAAKQEGHNNVNNEISAILDELLKLKEINSETYKKLLPIK